MADTIGLLGPIMPTPRLLSNGAPPERVLIVRMSHLGDVAQTLPLVHGVHELWPDAEIGWAIQAEFAPLVEPFARTFLFDRLGGAKAWPRIRRAMRAWGPDLTIDAQGNWKSAFCTRFSGARRRHGFEHKAWQEPLAARVAGLRHAPPLPVSGRPPQADHLVARCQSIAADLGVEAPTELPMDPLLSTEEIRRGRALLDEAVGGATACPITVLHPGVAGDPRTWPEDHFRELGERLAQRGRRVLFLTGPGETASGAALRAAVPEAAHIVGQRGLRELCALLHAVADGGGELFVSDSGPSHIAAAVGLPVRLLAGPEDPKRTGPFPIGGVGPKAHVVVAKGDAEDPWVKRPIGSVSVLDAERASDAATS